jgi:hypothetical protein
MVNQFKKSVDQKIQFSVIMMDDSAVQLFPSDRNTLKLKLALTFL